MDQPVVLLCGKGNNAGDAYVAGAELLREGYPVQAIGPVKKQSNSELCEASQQAFLKQGGQLTVYQPGELNTQIGSSHALIIDGLLGTGFEPP